MKLTKYTRKIGSNKGKPRLWLEGIIVHEIGLSHGEKFSVSASRGEFRIERDFSGSRKVAGTPDRPIIDTLGKLIESAGFEVGDIVAMFETDSGAIFKKID